MSPDELIQRFESMFPGATAFLKRDRGLWLCTGYALHSEVPDWSGTSPRIVDAIREMMRATGRFAL